MKNDSFKDYVLDQLRELGDLNCRPMFGGHGLRAGNAFFGIILQGRLYFKTTPAARPDFESRGMKPFRASARQTLRSYYEVPADIVEEPRALVAWARRSLGGTDAR